MAANTLILELGEKIVRACIATKKKKKYQIVDAFLFDTPEASYTDGQVVDLDAMADAIKTHLMMNGIKKVKSVIFTLNSTRIANREITIPYVKDNRIKTLIETNAEDYFPVDLNNYQLFHNVLEKKTKGPGRGYRILVLAVPNAMIKSYIQLADLLELPIEALDYSGNSQYQFLRQIKNAEVVMYVDVNVSNTYINIIENGSLLLQRNMTLGGDVVVSSILRKDRSEELDYLTVLKQISDDHFMDGVLPIEERQFIVNRLSNNIMRVMDYFRSNFADKEITKVVLMGACGTIAGYADMLAVTSGIETLNIQEFTPAKELLEHEECGTYYISCTGAAIAPLKLLPEDYSPKKRKRKKKNRDASLKTAKVFCGICAGASLVLCAYHGVNYYFKSTELAEMQSKAARLNEIESIYSEYENYKEAADGLQVMKDYKETPNAQLVFFFEELEDKMPKDFSLLSAECTNDGISLNITTEDYKQAAVVISQIRTFESITDIEVSDLVMSESETGETSVSFSIFCMYHAVEEAPVEDSAVEEDFGLEE